MDCFAARWTVRVRAERVSEVVERVRDWDTARRRGGIVKWDSGKLYLNFYRSNIFEVLPVRKHLRSPALPPPVQLPLVSRPDRGCGR